MRRSVLLAVPALIALIGLLAMHGITANHSPTFPQVVESTVHPAMGMETGTDHAGATDHGQHAMTELCFGILTGLVGLLLLALGLRRFVGGAFVRVVLRYLARAAPARASPPRPPSISRLCVLRT